jgi:hypothetical protein
MSDPRVQAWRQRGHVYLWRNHDNLRNDPGWECVVDAEGRASLIELLDLMLEAKWNASRSIDVTTPPSEILRLPGAVPTRWMSPRRIRLCPAKTNGSERHWHWSGDLNQPTLELGSEMLLELRTAIETTSRYGDFCIHADDTPPHGFDFEKMSIWFWPA